MSCPVLSLHISSNATIGDIGDILCIDVSKAKEERPGRYYLPNAIGPISMGWQFSGGTWDLGPYASDWNLLIDFSCPYAWSSTRILMALVLVEKLNEMAPGNYFAHRESLMLFSLRNGDLVFPREYEAYFTSFPLPFDSWKYEETPPS